jgi:hypothetical protein
MSAEGIAYVPGAEEALLDGIQDMVRALSTSSFTLT